MKKLIALIGILVLMACSYELPTAPPERVIGNLKTGVKQKNIKPQKCIERNSDAKNQIQKDRKD